MVMRKEFDQPDCNALRAHKGFTLIELLVVLSIIAILLTISAPRYFQHVERSKVAVLRENLATVRDAIDQYHADKGVWPDSLQGLVDDHYLRALPRDPITDSSETWLLESPTDQGEDGTSVSGVYNLHSGAEGNSSDGTPYSAL
jgi:general secretion pathway protein G